MIFASKGLPLNSGLTRPGIDGSTAHRGQAPEIAQAGMSHEYCRGKSDDDAYPPPSDPSCQLLIEFKRSSPETSVTMAGRRMRRVLPAEEAGEAERSADR